MTTTSHRLFSPAAQAVGWRAYGTAALAVLVTAAASAPLIDHLDLANIAMFFPLAVLFAAIRLGRGPAVLAAFLSVALFDFFFVPPHFTLVVSDLQYLLTFAVLLVVALITAELAAKLRAGHDAAVERERRTRALYEMARELSAALTMEQIAEVAARYVRDGFGAKATLQVSDDVSSAPTLPTEGATGPLLLLPLQTPMRHRGTLAIELPAGQNELPEEPRQLLETFAALIAIALERVHYVAVAQDTEVAMASERLRNSLLAALSHDLRTPLTALTGLADALTLTRPPLEGEKLELAQALRDEAMRTSAMVHNLLDMARLQSGRINLRQEWQPLEEIVGAALRAQARHLAAHRVTVDIPDDLPLVHIDAVLMERALCNLLENAGKYTPPGSHVDVRARVVGTRIELVVEDDGPGLPAGGEQQLFDKFVRGEPESSIRGMGLGLAIVHAAVAAHGGRVRAEAGAAGGARFVIELARGEPPALPEHGT